MSRTAIDLDTIPATGATHLDGIECSECKRMQAGVLVRLIGGLCRDCETAVSA